LLFTGVINNGVKNIPFPANNNFNNYWRIYARGASDNKATVASILNAYDAL